MRILFLALVALVLVPTGAEAYRSRGGVALPASIACPDDDGSAGAPTASIQYPSLLAGYVATINMASAPGLNCKVAGVDYAVGVPTAKQSTYTDWQSFTCSGCSISGSLLRVDGAAPTIDNVDFSLHNGGQIYVSGSASGTLTVTNSKFGCSAGGAGGYSIASQAPTMNFVIKFNTFDGTNCGAGQPSFIGFQSAGTVTLWYNQMYHAQQQIIETLGGNLLQTLDYRYNLIEDIAINPGAHKNYLQTYGSTATVTAIVLHNTTYEHGVTQGGEGFQFEEYTPFTNPQVKYNTMIAKLRGGSQTMSYIIHGNANATPFAVTTGGLNTSNYFDVSGAYGAYYGGTMTPARGWTSSGNLDMVTGATITPP